MQASAHVSTAVTTEQRGVEISSGDLQHSEDHHRAAVLWSCDMLPVITFKHTVLTAFWKLHY